MKKIICSITFIFSVLSLVAQVGIGTSNVNSSAKLQVDASDKGFLPPRVSLTGTADVTTIQNPASGLLVFNTTPAGVSPNNVIQGYYFWNGTAWVNLTGNALKEVGSINSTSSEQGATYSEGVLKLAPASQTHGGILTTGAQTLSGNKTIMGNLTTSPVTSNETLDVNNSSSNTCCAAPGVDVRQAFTVTRNGCMTSFKLIARSTGTYNVFIYRGGDMNSENNHSGTLIYQTTASFTPYVWTTISIPCVQVSTSNQYWFKLTSSGSNIELLQNVDVINPQGQTSSYPTYGANWLQYAFMYQSYVSTATGGNIEAYGTVTSSGVILTSDERLKTNIAPITEAITTISQLNPVHYEKKIMLSQSDFSRKENGFLAQELREVLPELVTESSGEGKVLAVDYISLIPILVKGIQEQQRQITELKLQITELSKNAGSSVPKSLNK